jgi:hypothetical protein
LLCVVIHMVCIYSTRENKSCQPAAFEHTQEKNVSEMGL